MKISEKIYRLRTENDLTQVQFGKIAGVSDKAVSTWEIGTKEPRMKPLQKICAYFDIDINKFVDTSSDVYKKEQPSVQDKPLDPRDARLNELLAKAPDKTKEAMIVLLEQLQESE